MLDRIEADLDDFVPLELRDGDHAFVPLGAGWDRVRNEPST